MPFYSTSVLDLSFSVYSLHAFNICNEFHHRYDFAKVEKFDLFQEYFIFVTQLEHQFRSASSTMLKLIHYWSLD